MYTLISGSSKTKSSNSKYFLNYISDYLEEYVIYDLKFDKYKDILDNIKLSSTIVIAFPLYADSPNSLTLKFLDYIFDNKINLSDKKIYAIINCGFKEGEQNITALNIIKRWCDKVGITYSGSILIGAGEIVGNPKYNFICKKAFKHLHKFSVSISNNEVVSDIITTMDLLNSSMYCFLANRSWNKKCKKNRLSKKDITSL